MNDLLGQLANTLDYLPAFLRASVVVIQLTLFCILLSWGLGIVAALARTSPFRLIRWPAAFYIWFIRGTPTIIQIFIVYFGLPQFGMQMSPFVAGVVALGVNSGAYVAEIIRGGLLAIPRGQTESAVALGMSYTQTMRRVILPQVTRIVLPPITNEATTTLKNTSLLSTITVMELTMQARIAIATTFRPFEFYIMAAILYLIMTTALMWLSTWVERRYAVRY